jgi:hypothetical protein
MQLGSITGVSCTAAFLLSLGAAACGGSFGRGGGPAPGDAVAKQAPPVTAAAAAPASDAPLAVPLAALPVDFEKEWRGFGVSRCTYLAPRGSVARADGAVDVVFHFHAGQMSERELRASGVRGVFVSCGYGIGTGGYSKAFEDPRRFGWMVQRLLRALAKDRHEPADGFHLGRLALASWSAGFASVNRILAVPEWYAATDAVILLDGIHAQYMAPNPGTPGQGVDRVDVKMLRHFIEFATDAAAGKKVMVITHSAIVPPDYASTTEATAALLDQVGVAPATRPEEAEASGRAFPSMGAPEVVADQGGLHVRGFRGKGPHDHFDHLHLIGDALRSWVLPRWYTPRGERR